MIQKRQTLSKHEASRREKYLSVYRADQSLLMELIKDCGLFDVIRTQEEITMHNYAIRKLEQYGLLDELKLEVALEVILRQKNVMDNQPSGEDDPYVIE